MTEITVPNWRGLLTEREQDILKVSEYIMSHAPHAGVPGQSMFALVNHLAQLLDRANENRVNILAMWRPKAIDDQG